MEKNVVYLVVLIPLLAPSFGIVTPQAGDLKMKALINCTGITPCVDTNLYVTFAPPVNTIQCDQVVPEEQSAGLAQPPELQLLELDSSLKFCLVFMFDPDAAVSVTKGYMHFVGSYKVGSGRKLVLKETLLDYQAPAPPFGDKPHRYVFLVYCFKTEKLIYEELGRPFDFCKFAGENDLGIPVADSQIRFSRRKVR